jgi:hypothetical protein
LATSDERPTMAFTGITTILVDALSCGSHI